MANDPKIVKADCGDIEGIISVLLENRMDLSLFMRSKRDLERTLQNFLVAKDVAGRIVACAELRTLSSKSAEIVSLAVRPNSQRMGFGRLLVTECTRLAERRGIRYLWVSSLKPGYFILLGFHEASLWSLPIRALIRKVCDVFKQPLDRWLPSLTGKYYFMKKATSLSDTESKSTRTNT